MYAIQPSFALVRITHRMITLLGLMERYWYYLGIMVMFGIGWVWPSTGLWMRAIGITPYLVAFAFFMNGFALSSESLLDSMKQWRVLCCALIISFAISPALVLAIRCLVPGCNTLLGEGFQIVSLVPTLFVSTVVLTRIAKGNAAVALYLTVTSNLLAIIIAPLLIRATLGASGSQLNLSATSISMIFTVLFPTILGQVARKRWEVWAERRAGFVTIISQCTILIFIVIGVSSLPRSVISTSMAITAIIGGLVLHAVLISIGRLGGIVIRAGEPERRALTFCSAQNRSSSTCFCVSTCLQETGRHLG